jgi:dUTP pyrophosphatase
VRVLDVATLEEDRSMEHAVQVQVARVERAGPLDPALRERGPLPRRATAQSAGLDLVAWIAEPLRLAPGERALVGCGFAMQLPDGVEAQVRPRSGLALKHGVTLLNAPGTVDADYRGEVGVILVNHGREPFVVEPGMRVAQLVIARLAAFELEQVPELRGSARGSGGFGSTGLAG